MWVPGVTEETAQSEEPSAFEVYSPTMGFTNSYMSSYIWSIIGNSISPTHEWKFDFRYEFTPSTVMSVESEIPANAVQPLEMLASKQPALIQGQGSLGWSDLGWTFEPTWIESHGTRFKAPPMENVGEPMAFEVLESEPKQMLQDKYPATLKDEGIGGTTVLYLFVNTDGTVSEAVVKTSSGHPSLDWAAVQAAKSARFLPASNEGIPVGIWIEMEMPFVAE